MTATMRDLDEVVAKALGWTHLIPGPDWQCPEILHWLRPDGSFKGSLPAFSTDPAHIPEMLAWLLRQGSYANVTTEVETHGVPPTQSLVAAYHSCCGGGAAFNRATNGDTIQHALALLVVAVSNARLDVAKRVAKEGA